jgi:uridine kinase
MFLGFSFGILTLLIPPMQGWYYWIVPFFVYFYIKQENAPKFIFVFLNIFYFLYFFLIRDSDIFSVWKLSSIFLSSLTAPYYWFAKIGLNPDYLVNISFTLLQGSLFLNILWIYRKGIESLIKNKINYQPYLIAVAGDSGSGKSTLTDLISAKFGQENTLVVAGDDAHRWERGDSNWSKFTHLDPRANKLHDELEQIVDLRAGRSVQRSFYDHSTGKFTVPVKLHSKKIIVFQGLHSLFLNKMRDFYDLKIYIKPSEALRLYWKVQRDMKERGYDAKKVLEQIKQRASDSEKYINPQDAYADIIVSFNTEQPIVDYSKEIDELGLYLKIIFENNINILPLLTELDNVGSLKVNHYYDEDKQILEIRGEADVIDIDRIAYKLIPELWEVVKDDPHWSTGYNGLIQLFVGYYIFQKMRLEHRYEY